MSSNERSRGLQHVKSVPASELRPGQIIGVEGCVLATDASDTNRARVAVADAYGVDRGSFVIEAGVERLFDVGAAKPDGTRGYVYRESRVLREVEVGEYMNLGGGRVNALVSSDQEDAVRVHLEIVRNWADRAVDEEPVDIVAPSQWLFDVLRPLNIKLPPRGAANGID